MSDPFGLEIDGPASPTGDPAGPPESTPDLADGRERPLDPQVVTAERFAGAIGTAVLALLLAVGSVLTWLVVSARVPGLLLFFAAWLLAVAAIAAWSFWWPGVRYRHTAYAVDATGITIRRGVLWRSVINVPRRRVQHTDVSQGPIERGLGLSTLTIHTAGTEHAAVSLGGLPRPVALALRDYLLQGRGKDDL